MLLRPAALMALLALALAGPGGPAQDGAESVAIKRSSTPPLELSPRALDLARASAATLGGKRGFALAERLDEIVRSREFELVLQDVFDQLGNVSYAEIQQAIVDYDFDGLFGQLTEPIVRPLAYRIFAALLATYQLIPEDTLAAAATELAEQPDLLAQAIDGRDRPAALRRSLRHICRGYVALLCLPFAEGDAEFRLALFEHAAIGVETNLRVIAAASEDEQLAKTTLRNLRLEPLDLDALLQRQQQLDEARELLEDIRQDIPEFRLPPDPGLHGDLTGDPRTAGDGSVSSRRCRGPAQAASTGDDRRRTARRSLFAVLRLDLQAARLPSRCDRCRSPR